MNVRINVEFKVDDDGVEDPELLKKAIRSGVEQELSDLQDKDITIITQDGDIRPARIISISYDI